MLLPPLSLYIHIPWCIRKCPYCDFNSHKAADVLPEDLYIEALLADLRQDYQCTGQREIKTIFLGGGTPSLFSWASFQKLLGQIKNEVALSADAEITLEANPGSFEQEKFNGFKQAGINRLSVGVQSFNQSHLKKLGRIHNSDEAINAVAIAKQAGFSNINIDLMFGLPQQTEDEAYSDLKKAIALAPQHISWYQLTIEPNTVFYSKQPLLPDDEMLWSIQEKGQTYLKASGFSQYEISAYSQSNRQCQHNLNYWQFGDYIGIGAGAHSKITQPNLRNNSSTFIIERRWKLRQPGSYIDAHSQTLSEQYPFTAGSRVLSTAELPLEFMMNALRLRQGVRSALFEKYTGLPLHYLNKSISVARQSNLMMDDTTMLCATEKGYMFLNDLLTVF